MGKTLRIFISTSGLSALYQSIYAKNTKGSEDQDLFIVDALALKPSQKGPILQAISHHAYDWVVDMSLPMAENSSQVPSLKKRLTRKAKTLPGFKQVYDMLYQRQQAQESKKLQERLEEKCADAFGIDYEAFKLHTQPLVKLNSSIKNKFPTSDISYFEHGLGDYLDVMDDERGAKTGIKFHCVFDEELRAFQENRGLKSSFIHPVVSEKGFLQDDLKLETYFPLINKVELPSEKALVLIATQALKQFEVSDAFWEKFLDLCVDRINEPSQYTFLIKPHPRQEKEVIEKIIDHLSAKGLDVLIWDKPELKSLNLELIFKKMYGKVAYVFSPFSSAVFYLSRLYPAKETQYYFGIQPLFEFTQNSPPMYVKRWKDLYPLLKEVFGKHVKEIH
ncbi:MAG: alpha-2,8-polysialyltransferase family protein [Bacteroidia bacterium]|nr:alpha-2,8-polysialyltransferase family protein [Bacteroidia bacterium]